MKRISIFKIIVICLLGFALTFSSNVQEPLQAMMTRKLAPDMPNTALGILQFIGLLVAMVTQPIVGVFSDRAKSKWGRRLPFIVGGAVLIAVSLFLMASAPALWVLLMSMIFIQFASNVLQGPWQALIPDQVPEEQRGTASSIKAVFDIAAMMAGGAVAGMLLSRVEILGATARYLTAAAPVVLFIICIVLTAIWAKETKAEAEQKAVTRSVGEALKKSFYVNLKEYPSFRYWFVNKILFWGAFIAIQTFLINYLQDVVMMTESAAQSFFGNLKILLGVGLIVLALIAGWLSDKFGRKPLIIAAGIVSFAGAVILLFMHGPTQKVLATLTGGTQLMTTVSSNINLIYIGGILIGMGVGMYLSASWALATDIVPQSEAARYLGIANIATCIGSGVARLLGGVLIDPINRLLGSNSRGYLFLFGLATLAFIVSSLVVLPLPNKKKTA